MKNSVIDKFDREIAELQCALENADAIPVAEMEALQTQLVAKQTKVIEAKLYLWNSVSWNAAAAIPSPKFTGKPNTMTRLRRVTEQQWALLLAEVVRRKQIVADGAEKKQAVLEACRNMAEQELFECLAALSDADGADFREVLDDLQDGLLPYNAARYEMCGEIIAHI